MGLNVSRGETFSMKKSPSIKSTNSVFTQANKTKAVVINGEKKEITDFVNRIQDLETDN